MSRESKGPLWNRRPRVVAGVLLVVLVVMVALDWSRLAGTQDTLGTDSWARGLGLGAVLGVVLLVMAALLWRRTSGQPQARRYAGIGVLAVAVLLYGAAHPRRGGDDTIGSTGELTLLVVSVLLLSGLLLFWAYDRWTSRPQA